MNNATRVRYLRAMGIDLWVPKDILQDNPALAIPENSVTDHTDNVKKSSVANSVIEKNEVLYQNIATEWRALEQQVAGCRQCVLCETRTQTVFGGGSKTAQWMLIGEAPGHNEDLEGKPFVGRAGQLLTEMIRAIGLTREQVFIANILKCRPPDNRDPKPDEVEACSDYLARQIELVKPNIILAVGRVAAQKLLKTDAPLSQLRGKVHYLNKIPVVVVYHPAYLLRSLMEKRKAWQDLQIALNFFRSAGN